MSETKTKTEPKIKPDALLTIMACAAFIMLAIYLLIQDSSLIGPL
jgi:hypothetical protein